jgi:AcrR family transcriptional regulator
VPETPDPDRIRIERALIELVAEVGFPGLDKETLLTRAGVDAGAFDRQFASLQDCFDQVWEALTAEFTAAWNASFAGDGPWRDRLRAAAYFVLRYHSEDMTRAAFFFIGAASAGEVAQARRDRMYARGVEMVDEARTELDDPDSIPRVEAEAIFGAIYKATIDALRSGDVEAGATIIPQLMYIAVLPYLGLEAAEEELRRGPDDLVLYRRGDL